MPVPTLLVSLLLWTSPSLKWGINLKKNQQPTNQTIKQRKSYIQFNLYARTLDALLEGIDWYDIGSRSSSTSKVCLVLSSQHKQPQNLQRQFYHLPTRPLKINDHKVISKCVVFTDLPRLQVLITEKSSVAVPTLGKSSQQEWVRGMKQLLMSPDIHTVGGSQFFL